MIVEDVFVYRVGPLLSFREIKNLRCVNIEWKGIVDALLIPGLFQSCLDRMQINPLSNLRVVCLSCSISSESKILVFTLEFTSSHNFTIYRSVGVVQRKQEPLISGCLETLEKLAPLANKNANLCAHGLSELMLKRGRRKASEILQACPFLGDTTYLDVERIRDLNTDENGDLIFPEGERGEVFYGSGDSSEAPSPTFREIKNDPLNILCMICASFGDLDKAISAAKEGTLNVWESQAAIKCAIAAYAKWYKTGLIRAIEATMSHILTPFDQYLVLTSSVFPKFEEEWQSLSEEEISVILTLISSGLDNVGWNLVSFYNHAQKQGVEFLTKCDNVLRRRLGLQMLCSLKTGHVE